jgi:lysophospholipase L1-like esterase
MRSILQRKNILLKVLILTNTISLIFLLIISLHYQVPQKILNRFGLTNFQILFQPKGYFYYRSKILYSIYLNKQNYEIILLGDSITAGGNWDHLLSNYNIANYGIPGDTTDGMLLRLEEIYLANPKKVFIMIGTNDIAFINPNLNYTIITVFNNYQEIVNSLRKHGIEVIIQSTLNVLSENTGRSNDEINKLNDLLKIFCFENEIKYLDINSVLTKDGLLQKQYTTDGLHLNEMGYEQWKLIIIKNLEDK